MFAEREERRSQDSIPQTDEGEQSTEYLFESRSWTRGMSSDTEIIPSFTYSPLCKQKVVDDTFSPSREKQAKKNEISFRMLFPLTGMKNRTTLSEEMCLTILSNHATSTRSNSVDGHTFPHQAILLFAC